METNETENLLTLEQVVTEIKGLISQSALAKLDIGLLLIKHTEVIEHGNTEKFYEDIGIHKRVAQYYKSIAGNKEVQKLKAEGKLDGLSMTKIIEKAGIKATGRKTEEYTEVSVEEFMPDKCNRVKIFKVQYALLENKVAKLEAELNKLSSTAKAS